MGQLLTVVSALNGEYMRTRSGIDTLYLLGEGIELDEASVCGEPVEMASGEWRWWGVLARGTDTVSCSSVSHIPHASSQHLFLTV